jgi:hypothetical protein
VSVVAKGSPPFLRPVESPVLVLTGCVASGYSTSKIQHPKLKINNHAFFIIFEFLILDFE